MSTSTSGGNAAGTGTRTGAPGGGQDHLKPGDEAMAGTPGTGEDLCPDCSGSGKKKDGAECPTCEGTGRITQGIGGG
jgi:DnaJ-class molecular chaperone